MNTAKAAMTAQCRRHDHCLKSPEPLVEAIQRPLSLGERTAINNNQSSL